MAVGSREGYNRGVVHNGAPPCLCLVWDVHYIRVEKGGRVTARRALSSPFNLKEL